MLYRNVMECIFQFARHSPPPPSPPIFMKDYTMTGQAEMAVIIAIIYHQSVNFTVMS